MKEIILGLHAMNVGFTHKLVAEVPDDQMCAQPVPGRVMNHAAFLLGHLAWVNDNVSCLVAGTTAQQLTDWKDAHAPGAKPVADRSFYRPKAELLAAFDAAQARMADAFTKASPDALAKAAPERMRSRFPTIGHIAIAILTSHGAVHNGQISAWRRALGWPPIT